MYLVLSKHKPVSGTIRNMAHHQQTNHDRIHAAQAASISRPTGDQRTTGHSHAVEDEDSGDADEPPDLPLSFSKVARSGALSDEDMIMLQRHRTASLLTRALGSPELTPYSDGEAPFLTSDGGLTSPARTTTPSPPLAPVSHPHLPVIADTEKGDPNVRSEVHRLPEPLNAAKSQELKVEQGLGRKRCITFACSQKVPAPSSDTSSNTAAVKNESYKPADKPPRPCMLRFICPAKPSHHSFHHQITTISNITRPTIQEPENDTESATSPADRSEPRSALDKIETPTLPRSASGREEPATAVAALPLLTPKPNPGSKPFNRVDFQKSEATRFHEFAGSFTEDDEWTKEQTAYRQKITINDTLRKENAIRKIGEEAEQEAMEEDDDEYDVGPEMDDGDDISDDGNESDDEDGFAASDDESDAGSDFQFWTPGLTTAATSAENVDHIRLHPRRLSSQSSIESTLEGRHRKALMSKVGSKQRRRSPYPRSAQHARPGSPEVPDSSDFVVGTIDEDRPIEEHYANRRKRREQSKQKIIPQDIDPSFPNSDPEAANEDDELDEVEEDSDTTNLSESELADQGDGNIGGSDEEGSERQTEHAGTPTQPTRHDPPKRLRSPPPAKSCLFNRSTHRLRSPPPPIYRKISSPPSSRQPSPTASPYPNAVKINHLAQRPNLVHTTSLPRTPNPFWTQHRQSSFYGSETPSTGMASVKDMNSTDVPALRRGPIAIVQGLETKRQRRKEKYWRQHSRIAHAGKEKEKKCQPGRGVQRMREVGLEMADRFKGYKQGSQIVLSI